MEDLAVADRSYFAQDSRDHYYLRSYRSSCTDVLATSCPSNSQRPGTPLHHVPAFLRQLHSHRNLRPTSHLVPASSASTLQHGMFAPLGMIDGTTCFLHRRLRAIRQQVCNAALASYRHLSLVPAKHYTPSATTRPISVTFQ